MGEWPKVVVIRNIGIPVESWEEMDEIIRRYGSGVEPASSDEGEGTKRPSSGRPLGKMNPTDRTILEQFVEGGTRGVTTNQIGPALGRQGKGIRVALEAWSRRIGLVTEEGASAFEPIQRADGRGFRMVDVYLRAARSMLSVIQ
jgi:hypothetical protein